jgi:hypothetical protein
LAPETAISFTLAGDEESRIALFGFADIEANGMVPQALVLHSPDALTGTFEVVIGSGRPEAIPVRMTYLNVTAASVLILGIPTGISSIQLAPGAEMVEGVYNAHDGTIHFDRHVPALVTNELAPWGIRVGLTPWISVADRCRVYPIGTSVSD